ncbi:MAG: HEPN domain-containing protein [Dehalococcoidia bacterium]|nr:HEPN domain-containing protein [Dehalococcoidia bacterium]
MKPQTEHWLEMAEYDLGTAEAMFKSRRYVYVIFMCHLCVEKALKACITEFAGRFPPYTHSLTYLLQIGGLEMPPDLSDFIFKISDLNVATRYPEDLKRFERAQAGDYPERTREVFSWLRQRLISSGQ